MLKDRVGNSRLLFIFFNIYFMYVLTLLPVFQSTLSTFIGWKNDVFVAFLLTRIKGL